MYKNDQKALSAYKQSFVNYEKPRKTEKKDYSQEYILKEQEMQYLLTWVAKIHFASIKHVG